MTRPSPRASLVVRAAGSVLFMAALLPSCTTPMHAVDCSGAPPFRCGVVSDVKYCENTVVAVEGADCAKVGLVAGKHFCFVTRGRRCVTTTYVVKDSDCTVSEYTPVSEWSTCSKGTLTFMGP